MKVRFGFITDIHYATSNDTVSVESGGGSHLRRFNTAEQRFKEAALAFKAENENNGLDFWHANGDLLDSRLMGQGLTRFQGFMTDSTLAGDIPFYITQGHHDYVATGALGINSYDDYYNIFFNPDYGNQGKVENAYPGDAGYPYAESGGLERWPLSYTFTKGGIKFIVYTRYFGGSDVIDSDYGGHKTWLKAQLDVDMPVVIFSHCHIWEDESKPPIDSSFWITDWDIGNPHWDGATPEEDTIKYILENAQANVLAVFGGHWHDGNRNMELNGIKYFSMPGSIKTSNTWYNHTSSPDYGQDRFSVLPIRETAEAEAENAYYVIEIDEDLEVYITGYGYNGKKQTTNNFDRYPLETTDRNLLDGAVVEINNSRRFSLLDNIVLDVPTGVDNNKFIESNAVVVIDGESYAVGSDLSSPSAEDYDDIGVFVWGKGEAGEYTFQSTDGSEGEYTTFTHPNGKLIRVTWEGKGSHYFLVEIISGSVESTEIDAHPITYYKAKIGESELTENIWYINYNKRHAFKIYSDFDPIEDV